MHSQPSREAHHATRLISLIPFLSLSLCVRVYLLIPIYRRSVEACAAALPSLSFPWPAAPSYKREMVQQSAQQVHVPCEDAHRFDGIRRPYTAEQVRGVGMAGGAWDARGVGCTALLRLLASSEPASATARHPRVPSLASSHAHHTPRTRFFAARQVPSKGPIRLR